MLPHPASVKYVSALRKRRRSLRMPVHRTRFPRLIIIAFVVPLVPHAFSLQLVPLPYNFPYSIAYTHYADLEMRNDIFLDPFSHILGLPSLNENPQMRKPRRIYHFIGSMYMCIPRYRALLEYI